MGKKCTSKEEVDENEHKTRGRLNRKTNKSGPWSVATRGEREKKNRF